MQFFWYAVQIFWCAIHIFLCAGKNFLSEQYKLWPPHGASFTAIWSEFCRLMARVLPPYVIFEAQYKSLLHFSRGGGCKSLSMDSLLLSKTTSNLYLIFSVHN